MHLPSNDHRHARRGVSTLLLIASWSLLISCLALALDTALVFYQGRQLQTACEAASLAGAAELLDPSSLTPHGLQQWLNTGGSVASSLGVQQGLQRAAAEQARRYAAANSAGGKPVEVQLRQASGGTSDITVGRLDVPTRMGESLLVAHHSGGIRANTIAVRASRKESRGNPVTLWFSRAVGIANVDLTASSRATLDHNVYALRPTGHVRVPLVPLVVTPQRGDKSKQRAATNYWIEQATKPADPARNDRWQTRASPERLVQGGDGISEITLTIARGAASTTTEKTDEAKGKRSSNTLFVATSPNNQTNDLTRRLVRGYGTGDLVFAGGQISIGNGDGLVSGTHLPIIESKSAEASTIVTALQAIVGQKRIWLLGDVAGKSHCQVQGFAVGQIAGIEQTSKRIRITVQPSQLITCTAQTGMMGSPNPWIGKLVRTQ